MALQHKILIIGPAWVGDMVMAQALFKLLKLKQPGSEIHVLAPAATAILTTRMPEVAKTLTAPFQHGKLAFFKRWQWGRSLRQQQYTTAIVLPNSWKSALIPFFAGIPQRIGYLREARYILLNDLRVLDKTKVPLMIQRFLQLGLAKNEMLPLLDDFYPKLIVKDPKSILAKLHLKPSAQIIGFCPGAEYGPAKRWPVEHFATLAVALKQKGYAIWLFGAAKDREIAEQINQLTGNICQDLTGQTDLCEVVDLMNLCQAVVSNDSGLMHIAASLDINLVALYGASSPKFTPPLSQKVRILSLQLACSPCFQRVCPLGHFKCLRDLQPSMVINALDELL